MFKNYYYQVLLIISVENSCFAKYFVETDEFSGFF